jgi:hypothetical protein
MGKRGSVALEDLASALGVSGADAAEAAKMAISIVLGFTMAPVSDTTIEEARICFDKIASHGQDLEIALKAVCGETAAFGGATMNFCEPSPSIGDPEHAALAEDAAQIRKLLRSFLAKIEHRLAAWTQRRGNQTIAGRIGGGRYDNLVNNTYLWLWCRFRPSVAPDKDFKSACYAIYRMTGEGGEPKDALRHALDRFLQRLREVK